MYLLALAVTDGLAKHNLNVQVPEGGSEVTYLLCIGLVCLGAMFLTTKVTSKGDN
jgi:hypothetical protein